METASIPLLVDAMESAFDSEEIYYDSKTGEIVRLLQPGNMFVDETAEDKELREKIENSGHYFQLPDQTELNDYSIMEDFAEEVQSRELMSDLNGSRYFRRFKDTAIELGLIDQYYAFRRDVYANIAIKWCKGYGIPYTEKLKIHTRRA